MKDLRSSLCGRLTPGNRRYASISN
uniref:Uncharacterized protein n=1 Tax=Anguilla anguilla TaxID=7936 RepID=A0A0E9TN70_ANGAN